MMRCKFIPILAAVLATNIAPVIAHADCEPVAELNDGWRTGAPGDQQIDAAPLCAPGDRLAALKAANAHGILVARHGTLIYEKYFAGDDQRWPQRHWKEPLAPTAHDAATKHDLQSISKSIVALLVGAALERGALKSIDASVLSLVPQYADLATPQKERIRLRDLLTMRSGLAWPYKPYLATSRRMEASADAARFVLEQPMESEPGTVFHYNNGSAEVVGGILGEATGMPLDKFADQTIFQPLGIADWEWGRMASGQPGASWGLRLRLRDLARIGQLVLDRGQWNGKAIVPADWIALMTAPQVARPKNSAYGFFWWLDSVRVGGRDHSLVYASGWGGQSLTLAPDLDLLVAVNAGVYDFDGEGQQDLAVTTVLEAVLTATR